MGRKPWGSSAWAIHLESHEPQKAVPAALVAEDSGAVTDAATELLEVFLDGDVQMEWFFLLGARPLLGVGMDPGFLAGHDASRRSGEAVAVLRHARTIRPPACSRPGQPVESGSPAR